MSAARRPWLVFFDFETTGTDPYRDHVVEIAMIPEGPPALCPCPPIISKVQPGISIPAEATAVHGITNEDVAHAPPFSELASKVQTLVDAGIVLVGYNSLRFDTILLDVELRRAGQPGLRRDEHGRIAQPEVDLFQLWARKEPRTLAGAVKRFLGGDLEDAHSAAADTEILPALLDFMLPELKIADLAEAVELTAPEDMVDRDGKFRRTDTGEIVFAFGKHEGRPVTSDPGYLEWILKADFSLEVKSFAREFLADARGAPHLPLDDDARRSPPRRDR